MEGLNCHVQCERNMSLFVFASCDGGLAIANLDSRKVTRPFVKTETVLLKATP